jgi:hypothetical protein
MSRRKVPDAGEDAHARAYCGVEARGLGEDESTEETTLSAEE